jgi:hypothetical protein
LYQVQELFFVSFSTSADLTEVHTLSGFAHAIQLVVLRPPQAVFLLQPNLQAGFIAKFAHKVNSLCSILPGNLQNINLFPKKICRPGSPYND